MPATLKNFEFSNNKTKFDEFYNNLCDIEDKHTSWADEDYADEIAELKWQHYCNKKEKQTNEYKSMLKTKEYLKHREFDLRRMLLHRIGKYELEEGEIFE